MALENLKIIIQNNFDSATLSATPALVPTLPLNHLKDSIRLKARTTTKTNQIIKATHTSPQIAEGIAIVRHTFTQLSEIKVIRKLEGAIVYEGQFDLGLEMIPLGMWRVGFDPFGALLDPLQPRLAVLWHQPVIYDELIIDINDPDSEDDYHYIDRIFDGPVFSPALNFDNGLKNKYSDGVSHQRTEDQSLHSIGNKDQTRQISLNLDLLSDSDRIALEVALSTNKRNKDLFVSCYPGAGGIKESRHMMTAKRDTEAEFIHQNTSTEIGHSTSIVFSET